jgi:hypothetical protein
MDAITCLVAGWSGLVGSDRHAALAPWVLVVLGTSGAAPFIDTLFWPAL